MSRHRRRRAPREGITLRLTPMIDVVFLLLAYFLLAAEFREPEGAVAASAAPDDNAVARAFELPRRPVYIGVRTVSTGPLGYVLDISSPELSHAKNAPALRRAAEAARGPVFADDQPFVIAPGAETLWEHALAVAGAIDAAGYRAVRFEEPQP